MEFATPWGELWHRTRADGFANIRFTYTGGAQKLCCGPSHIHRWGHCYRSIVRSSSKGYTSAEDCPGGKADKRSCSRAGILGDSSSVYVSVFNRATHSPQCTAAAEAEGANAAMGTRL